MQKTQQQKTGLKAGAAQAHPPGVHSGRIACRHCNHRNPGGDFVSGIFQGA